MNVLSAGDPLRQQTGKTVLVDDPFVIVWTGTHLRVEHLGRVAWWERVCAVDSNAEEVARAWWVDHDGKGKLLEILRRAAESR